MSTNKLLKEEPVLYTGNIKYALFILPIIYAFLLLLYYFQRKFSFTGWPDPDYCYLINGTNIATGNFDIGHYDHPGTPVQWLSAFVIFVVHPFLDKNPINESVLSNPEIYLSACTYLLIFLLVTSVYASGKLILKHTESLTTALFFQLVPFSWYFSVTYIIRIVPESFIIICVTYYTAFLFVLCYERNRSPESPFANKNFLLLFAFISALLFTTKITCAPFIIVPLFFIKGIPRKILFAIATFVFAAMLIYPIWSKVPQMFEWFTRLATHSGIYGSGKEEVIDKSTYLSNFISLLTNELFFGIGYILISIAAAAGWIMKKREDNFYKLTLVFWIVCTVQLFMVAKHFGYHYILPSKLLIIPGTIAASMALINFKSGKLIGYILLALCSLLLVFKNTQSALTYNDGNKVYESYLAAKKYTDIPKIITTGFQGTCFPESALRFGACYGGGNFYSSFYFLRKSYPNSYFYDLPQPFNFLKWWDVKVMPEELFEKNPKILVYFRQMDESEESKKEDEMRMLNNLTKGFEYAVKKIDLIENNLETGEHFYMLNIDTSKTDTRFAEKIQMTYDFEKRTSDNLAFSSIDGKFRIGETIMSTKEKHVSGNNGIQISPNQYACCTTFAASPGDKFEISVNYQADDRPIGIALSAMDPGLFDKTSEAITGDNDNGWKKASIKAIIPANFPDKEVKFCLFYYGHKVCYADDLNIVISKKKASAPTPESVLPISSKFILKAFGNQYVSLGTDSRLISQPNGKKAEEFELVDMGPGKYALRALNGKFVSADRNQNGDVSANRDVPMDWEIFEITFLDKTTISLKSSNGKFVSVSQKEEGKLVAEANVADQREIFFVKVK